MAKNNLLVELDCLLDTRLPILTMLDEDIAKSMVTDGSYQNRTMDQFKIIPRDMFTALYNFRNKAILNLAIPTLMIEVIKNFVNESIHSMKEMHDMEEIILYINTHPYKLSTEEALTLVEGLKIYVPNVTIKVISMDFKTLTTEWVSENLSLLIMYYGVEWIEYQHALNNTITNPILDVGVMVPALLNTSIANNEVDQYLTKVEETFKTITRLSFISTKFFSIAT